MKRWLWPFLALALIVGGYFGWQAIQRSRQAAAVEDLQTTPLTSGPLTASVGATGTVRANQSAQLTFETSGTVGDGLRSVGDVVQKDELLVTLLPRSLPANVILAQADLIDAQRALEDLYASDLAQAQAQLALANARDSLEDAEYQWTLNQEGNRATSWTLKGARAQVVIAEKRLERARRAFDNTHGKVNRAKAQLALTEARRAYEQAVWRLNWLESGADEIEQQLLDAELERAMASLADAEREWNRLKDGPDPDDVVTAQARIDAAQATLDSARITAPFSGTITQVEVMPGDQVTPGMPAFDLADLSRLLVTVDVPEIDINKIQIGQPVVLNFDAVLDQDYHGEVVAVALTGTDIQGVVNYEVEVELTDADELVKPGMTAAVNIIFEQMDDILLIPNRAVRIRDGDRVVYRMQDGMPVPVTVTLGASSDEFSQLLEGDLAEGDLIVLNPPSEIFDFSGPPPFAR
jgi:HlyD family secretion protein